MLRTTTGRGGGRGRAILLAILFSGLACNAICCEAQQAATKPAADDSGGTADLAKATQNPVSSLISVPVQNNDNFGIGPFNRTQNVLNIQPVVPLQISKDWNMVIRWIRRLSSSLRRERRTWRCTGLKRTRRPTLRLRTCRTARVCSVLGT
jgi:hypothetical protein